MDTEPTDSALARIDHQRMMHDMTTVLAEDDFIDTPAYHALVAEAGDPHGMVSAVTRVLTQAEKDWRKLACWPTATFPEWFTLTDITDKYPEPRWPTVQEIWNELWPPAEEPEPVPVVVMAELLAAHTNATPAEATRIVETAATMPALPVATEPLALPAGAQDTQQMLPVAPPATQVHDDFVADLVNTAEAIREATGMGALIMRGSPSVRDEMVRRADEEDPVTIPAEEMQAAILEHYGEASPEDTMKDTLKTLTGMQSVTVVDTPEEKSE